MKIFKEKIPDFLWFNLFQILYLKMFIIYNYYNYKDDNS